MPARVREAASAMRTEETTLANALTWIINLLLGSRIKIPFSFLVKNRETFLGVSRRIASRKKVSLAGIFVIHLRIRNVSVIQTGPKSWLWQWVSYYKIWIVKINLQHGHIPNYKMWSHLFVDHHRSHKCMCMVYILCHMDFRGVN